MGADDLIVGIIVVLPALFILVLPYAAVIGFPIGIVLALLKRHQEKKNGSGGGRKKK